MFIYYSEQRIARSPTNVLVSTEFFPCLKLIRGVEKQKGWHNFNQYFSSILNLFREKKDLY